MSRTPLLRTCFRWRSLLTGSGSLCGQDPNPGPEGHVPGERPRLVVLMILGMVVAGGLTLRLPQMDDSLWLDELHTSWTTVGGLEDVAPRARLGNNTPLYFWESWFCQRLLGQHEWALRLPSLIAGLLTIAGAGLLVYGVTRQTVPTIFAAILLAIDPHAMYYSLEARPYSHVGLLGLGLTAILIRLCHRPTFFWRFAYWSGVLLMFALHYTSALIPVSHFIAVTLLARHGNYGARLFLRDSLITLPVVAISWPQLQELAKNRGNWTFVEPPSLSDAVRLWPIATYGLLPVLLQVVIYLARWLTHSGHGSTVRNHPSLPTEPGGGRLALTIGASWLMVPIAISAAATWCGWPLCERRYLCGMLSAPAVVAALVLGNPFLVWPQISPEVTNFSGRIGGGSLPKRTRAKRVGTWLTRQLARFGPGTHALTQATVGLLVVALAWQSIGPGHIRARRGTWVHRSGEDWRAAVNYLNTSTNDPGPIGLDAGLIETWAWLGPHRPAEVRNQITPEEFEYLTFPLRACYKIGRSETELVPLRWMRNDIWPAENSSATNNEFTPARPLARENESMRMRNLLARGTRAGYRTGQVLTFHVADGTQYPLQIGEITRFGALSLVRLNAPADARSR